jgi:hypothetical protein
MTVEAQQGIIYFVCSSFTPFLHFLYPLYTFISFRTFSFETVINLCLYPSDGLASSTELSHA